MVHNHMHIIGNVFVSRPPLSAERGEEFLRELVARVGMTILMDSRAIYCEDLGNEGVTGLVALSTSHASFHCWHKVPKPFLNFDLYSCCTFDPKTVLDLVDEYFGLRGGEYLIVDRNDGLRAGRTLSISKKKISCFSAISRWLRQLF